jgi:hypothetical protein
MSWPEPTPLQVGESVLIRLVYEFRELLSESEYVELLYTVADVVAHDLAEGADWTWGESPHTTRSAQTPLTPAQVGAVVLRGLVFELREQLSPGDYVALLKFVACFVPEELAEQANWAEWEQRRP